MAKLHKNLELVFDNFDIEVIEIPVTRKQAILDGWLKVKEKK